MNGRSGFTKKTGYFTLILLLLSAFSLICGCGGSNSGQVILQKGGQTVIYTQEEYDRLIAEGKDPYDAFLNSDDSYEDEEEDTDEDMDEGMDENTDEDMDDEEEDTNGSFRDVSSGASVALDITPSEASQIKYMKMSENNGYFTCEIPEGWNIEVGLKPGGEIDLISYAIWIYDPKNPDIQLYYNLSCLSLKSDDAYKFWTTYYPGTYDNCIVASPPTVESFFTNVGKHYGYTDFETIENLGKNALGCDVIMANCTSKTSGDTLEGLFSASIVDAGSNMIKKNPASFNSELIDAGSLICSCVVMETAPEGEFIDYKPILDHCLGSITFSRKFLTERNDLWKVIMKGVAYSMQTSDQIRDMIMESYDSRNTTYDVISQKNSDATLGYERVLDTETGD
ncbi:MAG: hypothetical protein K6B28_05795, partial [Lachnospiraceae bacterium]|nr:hypothetical protein [Lachnospiraceae bacterium]